MSKQESIREGISAIIDEEICADINGETWIPDSGIDRLLKFLHSQGVGISNGGTCAIGDLAVLPLIEE